MTGTRQYRQVKDPDTIWVRPNDRLNATIAHFEPPRPSFNWCGQCEKRVTAAQAEACGSQWCKGRGQ